ncbi:hypothetical protein EDB85DRAFT_1403811 [Lactarius pseudohatsudake]|nr:hypothetical protein EDB85DRAFT_1403811 [Lactarius pseudohatsudake]
MAFSGSRLLVVPVLFLEMVPKYHPCQWLVTIRHVDRLAVLVASATLVRSQNQDGNHDTRRWAYSRLDGIAPKARIDQLFTTISRMHSTNSERMIARLATQHNSAYHYNTTCCKKGADSRRVAGYLMDP